MPGSPVMRPGLVTAAAQVAGESVVLQRPAFTAPPPFPTNVQPPQSSMNYRPPLALAPPGMLVHLPVNSHSPLAVIMDEIKLP